MTGPRQSEAAHPEYIRAMREAADIVGRYISEGRLVRPEAKDDVGAIRDGLSTGVTMLEIQAESNPRNILYDAIVMQAKMIGQELGGSSYHYDTDAADPIEARHPGREAAKWQTTRHRLEWVTRVKVID